VPKSRRRAKKVTRGRPSSQARALEKAHAANRRGWRLKPVVADFERVSKFGERHLAEGLIARHTLRMERISALPESYTFSALTVLAPLIVLDHSLRRLGARGDRFPADFGGDAPDHYAWACDSVVACVRLLLCGEVSGAAVIARNQLERWTLHRANLQSMAQLRYIGADSAADEALGLLPRRARLDGPTPVGDNPAEHSWVAPRRR
jgi:hypothetical protein